MTNVKVEKLHVSVNVSEHIGIALDGPGRVEVSVVDGKLAVYVYDGIEVDVEADPIGGHVNGISWADIPEVGEPVPLRMADVEDAGFVQVDLLRSMDMSWDANHHDFHRSDDERNERVCVECGFDRRHPYHGSRPRSERTQANVMVAGMIETTEDAGFDSSHCGEAQCQRALGHPGKHSSPSGKEWDDGERPSMKMTSVRPTGPVQPTPDISTRGVHPPLPVVESTGEAIGTCGFQWRERTPDGLSTAVRTCVLVKEHSRHGKLDHEWEQPVVESPDHGVARITWERDPAYEGRNVHSLVRDAMEASLPWHIVSIEVGQQARDAQS